MAQQFDVGFKLLFRHSRGVLSRMLFGDVVEWHNIEQPEIRNLRADLLARTSDGDLRHVELQVTNNSTLPLRMLEYYVGFQRSLGEHVTQTILYAGRDPLRMASVYVTPSLRFEFAILNLREMDGTALLESEDWADNEFALLTKSDPERVIGVVLDKLRRLSGQEQETAASTFVIIGGILGIEDELARRLRSEMIDLMENKVLGPAIRQGMERGREEGREEGLQEGREEGLQQGLREGLQKGRSEGSARVLRLLLEKRFGPLPEWATAKLAAASPETLETWTLRVDDSTPLERILS